MSQKLKWGPGARRGRRVILSRDGKKLTVKCDCGSRPHIISLPTFLQTHQCRECYEREGEMV